uniref:Uncharacterized protein n=2 Tax=Guillardia theta TaxID=55529 RepID=A0A7S4KDE0_GUITH|mmetsp:Transcript_22931/g.74780  ORF Transcript_22931/g.74780 Transcript_22931/m.74780 type:complete len:375 (+) Transcript_22931:118-1242(+)
MADPNPLVNNSGVETLLRNGIPVTFIGEQEEQEAKKITEDFVKMILNPKGHQTLQGSKETWGGNYSLEVEFVVQLLQRVLTDTVPADCEQNRIDLTVNAAISKYFKECLAEEKLVLKDERDVERLEQKSSEGMIQRLKASLGPQPLSSSREASKASRYWLWHCTSEKYGKTSSHLLASIALVEDNQVRMSAVANSMAQNGSCIMAAVKGQGLRYWPLAGGEPSQMTLTMEENRERCWEQVKYDFNSLSTIPSPRAGLDYPPWLCSGRCSRAPFSDAAPALDVGGGVLEHYWRVCQARAAACLHSNPEGFSAAEHGAGILCVEESGGKVTDKHGRRVTIEAAGTRDLHMDAADTIIVLSSSTSQQIEEVIIASQG